MVVETFDGSQALKVDCRRIKGEYYEMNRQCFKMPDGKWHRINNGLIVFDHEYDKWVLKNSTEGNTLIEGFINSKDGKLIRGHFSPNPLKNVEVKRVYDGGFGREYELQGIAINEELLIKADFVEVIAGDFYIKRSEAPKSYNRKGTLYGYNNRGRRLNYSAKDNIKEFSKYYNEGFDPKSFTYEHPLVQHASLLGSTTFGLEFETSAGYIGLRHLYNHGLIPLRDGSIGGVEFTTIPLEAKKGVHNLECISNLLTKYTKIDHNCSLHIHVGNNPMSLEFLYAIYKVNKLLEKELFSMFPPAYKHTSEFKANGKDYTSPLPNLRLTKGNPVDNGKVIYEYLSGGMEFQEFGRPHPNDREDRSKWHIPQRYFFVNFVSYAFNERGTIEYRIHPPTNNKYKIINWLFIVNAIVRYTEKYINAIGMGRIKGLTLDKVLRDIYPEESVSQYLTDYVELRKKISKENAEDGDRIGIGEIKNDEQFKI